MPAAAALQAQHMLHVDSYPSLWHSRRSPYTQFLVPTSSALLWASISSSLWRLPRGWAPMTQRTPIICQLSCLCH